MHRLWLDTLGSSAFWIGILGNLVASALITGPGLAWQSHRRHKKQTAAMHAEHRHLYDLVRAELRGTSDQP